MKKLITVFGPSTVEAGSALYREAESLGRALARAHFSVVNGGFSGVMQAVSKGAMEAGASVIGVTAEVYTSRGRTPNQFLTREVKVKSAVDRLMELIDLSDAAIAIGTSPGTLLEVVTYWEFMVKNFITRRPLLLIGSEWQLMGRTFDVEERLGNHRELLTYVENVDEAISALVSHFGPQRDVPQLTILQS